MLKVVHLNTYDGNGGAGRACIRLNSALLSQNINSKIDLMQLVKKLSNINLLL